MTSEKLLVEGLKLHKHFCSDSLDVTGDLSSDASNFLKQSQEDILTALKTYISAKETPGKCKVL